MDIGTFYLRSACGVYIVLSENAPVCSQLIQIWTDHLTVVVANVVVA